MAKPVSRQHDMKRWCQKELSRLLNFPVEEELVGYLLSMQTAKDVEEYLSELLGADNPGGLTFRREFLSHWKPPRRIPSSLSPQEGQILEELMRPPQEDMVLFQGEGACSNKGKTQKKESSIAPPPGFTVTTETSSHTTPPRGSSTNPAWNTSSQSKPPGLTSHSAASNTRSVSHAATAKKKKFVPLMSREGQSRVAMHVPGRHVCQCLAQKHELVNNCIECGRIVCTQEGCGPCIFCGTLIFPPDEEKMLAKDSKKAQKMKEKLIKQYNLQEGERAFEHFKTVGQVPRGLDKAVEHKDKLLNFDITSAQRTHVLDDEHDFFAVDATSWATPEEKAALQKREKELRERKYGSRKNKAFTLDLAGRKVIEEGSEIEIYDEKNVRDVREKMKKSAVRGTTGDISNPSIPIPRPKFRFVDHDRVGMGGKKSEESSVPERVPLISRLQDRELQEMRDEGKCLSMHQPWATLLVEGIKRVEGRSWYTTHRGRLWIAAAAKVPDREDIEQLHSFYRVIYGEGLMFPCEYPTGCLLGCVDVTDCLSQEQYRDKYPDGESDSPYVFICQNPQQLVVKIPIKGDHKIWKLPKDIHNSAKASCQLLVQS